MRNPVVILDKLGECASKEDYKLERLYRNLYNTEFYLKAYSKIYSKEGNMTSGSDGESIDGFSLSKVEEIIESIKNESYQPEPARREYIPKKNGKKRPLGIPSFKDKLVQEVVREILEAIYEPNFSDLSHGFRPNRSCQTALLKIKANYTGVKWWVEGDIKGFFDNIDHNLLIDILRKRIKDERFLRLIWKFLRAGYIEDFKYNKTYSGTPQGGIISPILSNIYLNEFDKFIEEYIKEFDKGKKRKNNYQYKNIGDKIFKRRKLLNKISEEEREELEKKKKLLIEEKDNYCKQNPQITNFEHDKFVKSIRGKLYKINLKLREPNEAEKAEIIREIKSLRMEIRKYKTYDQMDEGYKRMKYVRYADDFLIGIIGNQEDAIKIKKDLTEFFKTKLKLELSQEKTLITHNDQKVRFLGYDIFIGQDDYIQKRRFGDKNHTARTGSESVKLSLPHEVLRDFMLRNNYILITKDGRWKPRHRPELINADPLEMVMCYNAEFRGFYNYYRFAFDVKEKLTNAHFLFKQSYGKTLGAKYKTKQNKLRVERNEKGERKYHREGRWGASYTKGKGDDRFMELLHYDEIKFCKKIFDNEKVNPSADDIINAKYVGRNSLVKRLLANKCEWCEDETGPFEVHHIRKLKDLKGKENWEKMMISRKRKTMVLCGNGSKNDCHRHLHMGTLKDPKTIKGMDNSKKKIS